MAPEAPDIPTINFIIGETCARCKIAFLAQNRLDTAGKNLNLLEAKAGPS
jgi:hypothetical protein